MNFVSDESVEKALDYLRDNAAVAGNARANRIYMEEFRKVVKARVMSEHLDKALAAQEREAYSDERYISHLKLMSESIAIDETHRFHRAAAEAKIEAWRTQSATERAMKL